MGIPKFFRYISERYPLTSQLITENKIPEFDNLYLDFNGIIHNCSHPNDEDAHFRLTEEQIFTSIFAYVDLLFSKVKPKKLFFMAVDGVAPRAKMNQQRSRRFRTAKEAKEVREKAERKGEKLPDEKAFDSNCITPGTVFMAKLSDQLRYFINKKITEDSDWRDIEVVLSGHEVPGEGEHKIMEYIRLSRAQEDYNPNVRHCLYGLDADLIMLGLLSHDPHFCLLREEVKFGPAARKKGNGNLESISFYLLHLSLMREYLNLEFHDIADTIPFAYDLERIIDDFVLLAVFVGNDFLPNLPDLHIHENGLERLFDVYKRILPSLDGYINEGGIINTRRLQVILDDMSVWEEEVFQKEYSDMNWYKGKQAKHVKEMELAQQRSQLVLTGQQRGIFDQVKEFVAGHQTLLSSQSHDSSLTMPNIFAAGDRKFISSLAEKLHLSVTWDEYDNNDQNLVTWRLPDSVEKSDHEIKEEADDDFEESEAAIKRVLKKYEEAPVVEEEEAFETQHERTVQQKMNEWKDIYYKSKLGISCRDEQDLNDLVFTYVEGLQWVMHYYYSGVASWSWFYNYHYAPRISDLRGLEHMQFSFDLGVPFLPFQQLMGVLPTASKELIPAAYQDLMYDPTSPLVYFYPTEFEQDLNGKKQDWEAIVKIPFIDEQRLVRAMDPRDHRLTQEEQQRNKFGSSTRFRYDPEETTSYPSSLPGFFPALTRCACKMEPFNLPTLDGLHLVDGLCDGVVLGADALAGFPSLNTLRHTAQIGFHGVNVHGSESRNKSVVVHVENIHEDKKIEEVAGETIGKRTFVGWPFLQEGLVVAISDSLMKYEKMDVIPGKPAKIVSNPHSHQGIHHWKTKAERIEQTYSKRFGVITGTVDVLLHVRPLKGLSRAESGAFKKEYEGMDKEMEVAAQMAVSEVVSEDPRFLERDAPPLSEEFQEGSKIFFLGEHAYGAAAKVASTTETSLSVILAFNPSDRTENELFNAIAKRQIPGAYLPSFKVAETIGVSGRALSKITSSFMVVTSDNQKSNLGLNLKFDARALKVVDYSRKDGYYWEFSEKAVSLIQEYKAKFPTIFGRLDRGGDDLAKAADVLPGPDPDNQIKEVKAWLKSKGIRDLVPVSLFCDQLPKDKITEIEKLANDLYEKKSSSPVKKAVVKGIPRQAVLKPSDAIYRLQNQRFALGDRVTMIRDSGGVPLSVKGVVVGLNAKSIDVIWDVPFMSGGTLGDRCSQYRGSTVEFNTCLNLSNPQFVASTNPKVPSQPAPNTPFRPRFGPRPFMQPPPGQPPAAGFRPARPNQTSPMHIMTNPNRNRGPYTNGPVNFHLPNANADNPSSAPIPRQPHHANRGGMSTRGGSGRGGFQPSPRGGFGPSSERGRGNRGAFRGRGRGNSIAQPLPS